MLWKSKSLKTAGRKALESEEKAEGTAEVEVAVAEEVAAVEATAKAK